MKRSQINDIYREAKICFQTNGWTLPPNPQWDVTDFGLHDFDKFGLVLINLAEHPEYCEKLMYARVGQTTPSHTHAKKKEDIICRHGILAFELWKGHPEKSKHGENFVVLANGEPRTISNGETIQLQAGERITLLPGIYHSFYPVTTECIIGEVSTANDDVNDNFFANTDIGRYPGIEEDEPAEIKLLSD